MSYSPEAAGKENASGKLAPEKPNFSQTCRLLSQFLKVRRSFTGDFGFGTAPTTGAEDEASLLPETKNLLASMEDMPEPGGKASDVRRSDFWTISADFIAFSGAGAKDAELSGVGKNGASTGDASAPMTIFYGGRVFVFGDFPADKLKEIADLAADHSGDSGTQKKVGSSEKSVTPGPAAVGGGILHARPDLPLATKASLHRFFARRKNRASSSAPYQGGPRSFGSPEQVESNIGVAKPDPKAVESSGHALELRL